MIHSTDDTIAAIATPIGEGAISVIRVSGQEAIKTVSRKFLSKTNLNNVKSHTAHFGKIINQMGDIIDEVICVVYKMPNSYTGEDTVEISCHGGIQNTKKVLNCILEENVRPAKPGEFTFRAFLNGKMDLSQAEAVADIIHSQSEKGHKISLHQLEGELSKKIFELRDKLVKATSLLELELDFVEENIELINAETVEEIITNCLAEVKLLMKSFFIGRIAKEGVSVALVGIPNSGKSSLMNAILKEERAIVTEIPGTTRDFIEERYTHDGILYRLIDTAGLRNTKDLVEIEGIKRTWNIIEKADVVIFIHDATTEMLPEENSFLEKIKTASAEKKSIIIANNKIDLLKNVTNVEHENLSNIEVFTSAKTLEGVENLVQEISRSIFKTDKIEIGETTIITNQRHFQALERTKEQLESALTSIKQKKSEEFIALDLRGAIDSIGEIVGLVTTEDILNEIFSKFCIGK